MSEILDLGQTLSVHFRLPKITTRAFYILAYWKQSGGSEGLGMRLI